MSEQHFTVEDHSVEIKCGKVFDIVAYTVLPTSPWNAKKADEPHLYLKQQEVGKVYFVRSPLGGYVIQRYNTAVGEFGAHYVSEKANLQDTVDRVCKIPAQWEPSIMAKVHFRLMDAYTNNSEERDEKTYDFWSKRMRESYGNALSATGIANKLTSDPLRSKPLHAAERVNQTVDFFDCVPEDWRPMLSR